MNPEWEKGHTSAARDVLTRGRCFTQVLEFFFKLVFKIIFIEVSRGFGATI